nr:MAG TPA: protein of unknown function (UPF0242) [Caudoviricetes sp.]
MLVCHTFHCSSFLLLALAVYLFPLTIIVYYNFIKMSIPFL